MKNFTVALLMAALTAGVALEAAAQTRSTAPRESEAPRETWKKPAGALESNKLIGAKVKSSDGKNVGEIDGLMVNREDGKVTHVIVGRGGVAGIGETKVVVPWSDVTMRMEQDDIVVSIDPSKLDQAPRYERRQASGDRAPAASPGTAPRENTSKEKK